MKFLRVKPDGSTEYPYDMDVMTPNHESLEAIGVYCIATDSIKQMKSQGHKIIDRIFDQKIYGSVDTAYGDISLDRDNQLDLYRGAIGARHANADKVWSHPVKLMNGTLVELSAPLMLFVYDTINEYINNLQRACDVWHIRVNSAETREELLDIYNMKR